MQAMAVSVCPSFSTHSSGTMADIAARVVEELRNEPHPDTANLFHWTESSVLRSRETEHSPARVAGDGMNEVADEEEDFEFAFVASLSPISADEIFSNGQIKPVYPVFNRDLLAGANVAVKIDGEDAIPKPKKTGRMNLRKLMTEERETTTSCSSSEADDLETVPSGTYCVWAPPKKLPEPDGGGASERKCKKSNSTGSSKRWKLRDLLRRSNSEGKDRFVFLSPSEKKTNPELKIEKPNGEEGGGGAADPPVPAHFRKSKTVKEGGKRMSYLGYKQDLVGILANVNGLSRNLRPF